MCIIVEKTVSSQAVSREWHKEFWKSNPDGFGVVEFHSDRDVGDRVTVAHTMIESEAWAIVQRINDTHSDAYIHYRQATHGVTNRDMCHPFVINTLGGVVAVTHNGMLSNYPTPDEHDHKTHSDTHAFVYHFLAPMLEHLDVDAIGALIRSNGFHWMIESLLGSSNRLVITDQLGHVTYNDAIWHKRPHGVLKGMRLSNTYAWYDLDAPPRPISSYVGKTYKGGTYEGASARASKPSYSQFLTAAERGDEAHDPFDDLDFTDPHNWNMGTSRTGFSAEDNAQTISAMLKQDAWEWVDDAQHMTIAEIENMALTDPELVANALYLLLNELDA